MIIKEIAQFFTGLFDNIGEQEIPPDAASRELYWRTIGDKIELIRGRKLLGTEVLGLAKITGLCVGQRPDGTQVLLKTAGASIYYYDTVTSDWIEIGTNLLTTKVVTTANPYGEDISMTPYISLAGAAVWVSSPNSGLIKIMLNAGTSASATYTAPTGTDNFDSTKNFKGYIKIKNNTMFLWNRAGATAASSSVKDLTGIYRSRLDRDEISDYTLTTAEARHSGDGVTKTFSGTLATISGKRTVVGATFTDGTETFSDDFNGGLGGTLGGTGLINYATGAYTITFNTAPIVGVSNITATYYYDDATVTGIADFTKSGTRAAGEGFVIRQDDGGGAVKDIDAYNDDLYCIHETKTWRLTISADDVTATNRIFREKMGIQNFRGAVESSEGTYYVDNTDQNKPRIRLATITEGSTEVTPMSVSDKINLDNYRFDKAAGTLWGDYVLFACRLSNSTFNNRVLAYNRVFKSWDVIPWYVSCWATYNGVLHCGDSLSKNVYELFSGFDDDESIPENLWEGSSWNLQTLGMKKSKRLLIQGEIGPEQSIEVYASVDNGDFVLITTITGNGAYVDRTQSVNVGAFTLGRGEVGGGGGGVTAYNYERLVSLRLDRFERIKLRFLALKIGYASVSTVRYHDIRVKSQKVPAKYMV